MNQIKYKFIKILLSVFLIFIFLNGATCQDNSIIKQIIGTEDTSAIGKQEVQNSIAKLASILAGIAATVAVIFILIGAFQYITSAGDEAKATKAKGTITWSIIGLILILASFIIINWFMSAVGGK